MYELSFREHREMPALTDYFKNGKCIFAVGDKRIAPIIYLNDNDAAITASSREEIGNKLAELIASPEKIREYARRAYECGERNHNENDVKETFVNTFIKAYEKRNQVEK